MNAPATAQLDPKVITEIQQELVSIEQNENVKILFAVESGSRAWGFPSQDSDYDVRFVYARPRDWYLSIAPGRDVIERPIDDVLDISGWDIQKALGLLLKPNPVMLEWLCSPIRYIWDDKICRQLQSFSREVSHAQACTYHYHSQGAKLWEQHVARRPEINLKKYLYVLRPALVLRWIRFHPDIIPPMTVHQLIEGLGLDIHLTNTISVLLAKKSQMHEGGMSARFPSIDTFITQELRWALEHAKEFRSEKTRKMPQANALFRQIINELG